jgi:hypothetical protein
MRIASPKSPPQGGDLKIVPNKPIVNKNPCYLVFD